MDGERRRWQVPAGLLVFLVACVAWFPLAPSWKSDDLIATQYAMAFGRVAHDFVGNQYGLPPGMVWFYRPLVTASFWLDGVLAGHDVVRWCWISHLSNVLAHALSGVLLLRLVARFCAPAIAFWSSLLWVLAPGHAGAIAWAVGRVDAHTTVWILLCALAFLRWQDGALRTRTLAIGAQVLALATKEVALVIPGIVAVLAFGAAPPGARGRAALRGVLPFLVVQGLYFAFRFWLFGRFLGGYEGGVPPLGELAKGLASFTWLSLNPLATLEATKAWASAGLVPLALALWVLAKERRFGLAAACGLLYVGCALPAFQFWPHAAHLLNLRYFYLPLAALLVLVAQGPRLAAPALAVVFAVALPFVRFDHEGHDHALANRAWGLREALARTEAPFVLVAPPAEPAHVVLRVNHLGLDRLAHPPFADGARRLAPLRPLVERPGAERLATPGCRPPATLLAPVQEHASGRPSYRTAHDGRVPEAFAPFRVELDGPATWTSQLYWDVKRGRANPAFVARGVRAPHFRVTVFTGGGYVSAVCADEAPAGAVDGRVAFGTWLLTPTAPDNVDAYVVRDLVQPTVLDLDLRMPVWIEAGARKDGVFVATRAAADFVWITFERDYAEWAAGRVQDHAPPR